ncbi:chemotaxis protein CheR [bacterium]|nr:chemotaxis protein CheR [bacterium]
MSHVVSLLKKDFVRLSEFIHTEYGIKMPEVKKTLLESRLQKRLRLLEINSFKGYCDYLFSPQGMTDEIPHFIDKITTNKTDFFRENEHFEFLVSNALPTIISSWKGSCKNLNVWSAGCSTGEEPYTLAMILSDFAERNRTINLSFSILATDISPEVLKTAKNAIYHEMRAVPIPLPMKKKYLLRSKIKDRKVIKMAPEIRKHVNFERLNFMDNNYKMPNGMDIIFCRNVIIYFDKPTQGQILSKILDHLNPGGFFFQGHSESTQRMDLPIRQIFPTVYQKI